jgi:glutamine cyclotransferase
LVICLLTIYYWLLLRLYRSQGLTYDSATDKLYESTGLYGHSSVRILDPKTSAVIQKIPMAATLFGEGMAFLGGQLLQITWKSRKGFIYNAKDLSLIRQFTYTTTTNQGWGITHDECRNELIVSDGSNKLHIWDPTTLQQTRIVEVLRQNGNPAINLNEIEFWRGRVLANVWFEDVLLVINPLTGVVEKEYGTSIATLIP